MNHTPGPWHCSVFRESWPQPGIDIGAKNNSNIALVHHDALDRVSWETKANARLIAAAPDLLKAAQYCIAWIDGDYASKTNEARALEMLMSAVHKAAHGEPK